MSAAVSFEPSGDRFAYERLLKLLFAEAGDEQATDEDEQQEAAS